MNHPGETKLYYTLKEILPLLKLKEIVKLVVSGCLQCQGAKRYPSNMGHLQGAIALVSPFFCTSTDIVGPYVTPNHSLHIYVHEFYILSIIDNFTKLVTLVPLNNITAESVTVAFFINWITLYPIVQVC